MATESFFYAKDHRQQKAQQKCQNQIPKYSGVLHSILYTKIFFGKEGGTWKEMKTSPTDVFVFFLLEVGKKWGVVFTSISLNMLCCHHFLF